MNVDTGNLRLVSAYVSRGSHEGHYVGLVIETAADGSATLFLPSTLETVPVTAERMARAAAVDLRPRVTRERIMLRMRQWGEAKRRYPRRTALAVLRALKAGERSIRAAASVAPSPEALARAERRRERAARRVEERAVEASIRDRVTFRLTHEQEVERAARVAEEKERRAVDAVGGVALPRPGTKLRTQYELLTRKEGCSTEELHAALGLAPGKTWGPASRGAREMAAKYGLTALDCGKGVWRLVDEKAPLE